MNKSKKLIFFAYKGKADGTADDNVSSIKSAILNYNQYQGEYNAKSWEDYKKTTSIDTEILQAIKDSEVFASDLSYFNHNVLFELGYACAKDKNILILLRKSRK